MNKCLIYKKELMINIKILCFHNYSNFFSQEKFVNTVRDRKTSFAMLLYISDYIKHKGKVVDLYFWHV
jgi:hypothetical protein